jgi:hypothetical protein
VLRPDLSGIPGQQQGAAHDVFQFADIARPGMGRQHRSAASPIQGMVARCDVAQHQAKASGAMSSGRSRSGRSISGKTLRR